MNSILDNPIWNALNSGSKTHSSGNDRVRYMQRDKGLFVGFQTYSAAEWKDLDGWFSKGESIILFTPEDLEIPATWLLKVKRSILQMVYASPEMPAIGQNAKAIPLAEKDIPAMLHLTSLTQPGPFFSKTIELGYFEGIFEDGKLVAMTGQRLHPDPYVEVSAVCTHPDFVGKGMAAELLGDQIRSILSESKIPFLHVEKNNFGAIKLYEKLGFRLRKEINVYFLEKAS